MEPEKKLRLIHLASSHLIGLTNQELQLAKAYRKSGLGSILIVTGENEQVSGSFSQLKLNNIPYQVISGFDHHQNFFGLVREFKRVISKFKPTTVSVNTNWQLLIVGLSRLPSLNKFRIVYTVHGFRNNSRFKSVVARFLIGLLLFLFADSINAPTRYVRDEFKLLGYKTKTIPLGEDDVFFENSSLPDFSTPIDFCFPGEFRKGKNQRLLVDAFSQFLEKTKNSQSKLYLCGSGALFHEVVDHAKKLGLNGRVIFTGQIGRKEMMELYRRCQVVIVPTNSETFGHCIAEPLIMQRIVISKPVGVALDCIEHGKNGFIFGTQKDLVDQMVSVASMDKSELERISHSAGETGRRFRWADVAKRNIEELMS
ncbi:glycosyltransferase family 4 protein [Marinobacter sp. chi1]|uniref:Glycosyltransferase family 4 protein n=1 Tax=Marinobacter suaedae TaxID=3057675 RepID=A0ABT8VWF8_9GAMM|nr:glycosyltransferase family 4 protein [Marinobacter sp. chi1]MDO3720317.1 glycosyltransferase family 4 protein [Marinobacter sp. chi1]